MECQRVEATRRRRTVRLTATAVAVVAVSLVASACSSSPAAKNASSNPSTGNSTATVALSADITTLDPMQQDQVYTQSVLMHLYNPLVQIDPANPAKVDPVLAKSWKLVNPTTYQFTLNTNATFSDGAHLSAADVKYSVDYMMGFLPGGKPSVQATNFPDLKSATVINNDTIDITTTVPDPLLPARMSQMLVIHNGTPLKSLATTVDGTGPYTLVRWERNEEIVLKAKPSYFEGPAKIKNVIFKVIPDPATELAALQSGSVDLISGLTPDNLSSVRSSGNARVESEQGNDLMELWLNTLESGPLHSATVRQALNYAVNTEAIVKELMSNSVVRTPTVAPPYFSNTSPSVKPYAYDPKKAKQLLASAGYPNGFTMTIMVPTDRYPDSSQIAQAIQQNLQAVGVTMKIDSVDFGTFVDAVQSRKIPDGFLAAQDEELFSPIDFMEEAVKSGTEGFSWYSNSQVDSLLAQAASTSSDTARTELVTRIQNLLLSDPPFIFLFAYKALYGVSDQLNWTPRSDGLIDLYGASLK